MTVYFWPVQQFTIAAGADIATETTQLLNKGYLNIIATKTTDIANWDMNTGAAGATTLRTVLATRHESVATPLSTRLSDGTDFLTCGAIAASQKSIATATKALDTISLFLGWDGTNHSEIKLDASSYLQLSARHEAVSTPFATRLSDGTDFLTCGAIAASQKTLTTATKALDTVSINVGWDGSTHRETLLDSGGRTLLATRHETVTTPLATRLSDGTDFITCGALAASQKTIATATKILDTAAIMMGWDTSTHRELLLDATGAARISGADLIAMKPEYAKAIVPVLHNFATSGITASAYTQVIASTAAKAIRWQITNSSGSHITVATGAAGLEASFAIIPPSGAAEIDINIAASTRISVTSDENVNTGKLSIAAFV